MIGGDRGVFAARRRSLYLGVVLVLMSLGFLTQGAGAVSSAGRSGSISCPAAPSGWTVAPANPTVYGPSQNPGQTQEDVTCEYIQGSKVVSVTADFALPTDQNPYEDFDYGCGHGSDQAWSAAQRIYFVLSTTQWGYAELIDTSREIADASVPAFEAVTRALLKSSEGFGHNCSLNTTSPEEAQEVFFFSFEWSLLAKNFTAFGGVSSSVKGNALAPAGSFTAVSPADGSSLLEDVASVHAPPIALTVVEGTKEHTVTVRITHGIDFLMKSFLQRLRVRIRVVSSNDSACHKGAQGTITISTTQFLASPTAPASVQIHLCGSLFSRGREKAIAQIFSG